VTVCSSYSVFRLKVEVKLQRREEITSRLAAVLCGRLRKKGGINVVGTRNKGTPWFRAGGSRECSEGTQKPPEVGSALWFGVFSHGLSTHKAWNVLGVGAWTVLVCQ
jgi:hypothetical protein